MRFQFRGLAPAEQCPVHVERANGAVGTESVPRSAGSLLFLVGSGTALLHDNIYSPCSFPAPCACVLGLGLDGFRPPRLTLSQDAFAVSIGMPLNFVELLSPGGAREKEAWMEAAERMLKSPALGMALDPGTAADVFPLADSMILELDSCGMGAEYAASARLIQIIILLSRCAVSSGLLPGGCDAVSPSGVWKMDDVVRYIDEHYAETFNQDYFVSRCAMNTSDFSRLFKEKAGCPLFEYINRQRVHKACLLLKSSSLSIIDIAAAVGYNSLSFFNRYFLRIIGCSPREFRNRSL